MLRSWSQAGASSPGAGPTTRHIGRCSNVRATTSCSSGPNAGVRPDAAPPRPASWRRWRSRRRRGRSPRTGARSSRTATSWSKRTEYRRRRSPGSAGCSAGPSAARARAADLGPGLVGAARPARPDAAARARPARRRVDERGVREHAVHPDGQLRRRRFRRRQHRCRHRRRVRPRRHRHRPSGRRDRRPHRTTPGDRVRWPGWVRCCRSLGAIAPTFGVLVVTQTLAPPDGHRARVPGRRRRRRGDAAQQPRLRDQHPGDGGRLRCGRRGDRTARWPTSGRAGGGSCTWCRSCGASWRSTSPAAYPRPAGSPPPTSPGPRIGRGSTAVAWACSPRWRSSATSSSRRRASSRTATSPTCRGSAAG